MNAVSGEMRAEYSGGKSGGLNKSAIKIRPADKTNHSKFILPEAQ